MAIDPMTAGMIGKGVEGLFGIYSANKAYTRQKEMMKNAHQWEVQDLRKAGLNPILSATGGSGAGSFTAPSADTPDLDLASAATASKELKIAQQNADTNKQNANTQERVGASSEKANLANADFSSANAEYVKANKVKAQIEARNLEEWLPKVYEAQIAKELAIAQGTLQTSSAQAYQAYEQGAFANKQSQLADFTLKSSLKYGKEGAGGLLSWLIDDTDSSGNLKSSANGGFIEQLDSKFTNWVNGLHEKYK